jgi:hypothetical protein
VSARDEFIHSTMWSLESMGISIVVSVVAVDKLWVVF